jgi:hypothetical protein
VLHYVILGFIVFYQFSLCYISFQIVTLATHPHALLGEIEFQWVTLCNIGLHWFILGYMGYIGLQ